VSPAETPINASEVANASDATGAPWETPSVAIEQGGQGWYGIQVDQGPVWLARLLYDPPWWLPLSAYAVLGLVALLAAVSVRRRGVEREQLAEMAYRATFLGSVLVAALALREAALFPYSVNVAGAVLVGAGVDRWARNQDIYELHCLPA
jgi:hypothetical protein